MWITPSRDPTYAELAARESIHGGGGVSANLVKPLPTIADQIGTLVKAIAPAVANYIQTKKSDAIANQLMNMENPPRAAAADQYGATYDPVLAVSQGLTSRTEPTATSPFTGGTQGMKVQNAYQAYLDQQQADKVRAAQEEQKSRLIESQIAKNYAPGDPKYSVQLPDGRIINVTGNEAAQYYKGSTRQIKQTIPPYSRAIARGKLDDKGEFYNNYAGAESGEMAQVKTPDGKTLVVPWSAYQQSQQQNPALKTFQNAQTLPEPDLPPITQPDSTPAIASQSEYNALPSGTVYLAPDGKKHRKP